MGSASRVGTDGCSLSRRWILNPTLADMLVQLDELAEREVSAQGFRWPGLSIISGYRSFEFQAVLNPLAPNSLHTRCPSLAADLRVGDFPASVTPPTLWALLGRIWSSLGGRWGGTFTPPDSNHFDLLALDIGAGRSA